jgi:hypothetical protein
MKSSKLKPTTVKIGIVQQFLVTLYQMKTRLFLISPSLFTGRANKVYKCTLYNVALPFERGVTVVGGWGPSIM